MSGLPINFLAAQEAMQASGFNGVLKFTKPLSSFKRSSAVRAVGGLLLLPQLQASNYRLEMLAHAVVSVCNGKKALRRRDLADWVSKAGKIVGYVEDPAEDVFAGRVRYQGRNYRVLEGLSEGGCFHLQLILKVVERMPEDFHDLKEACRACLILSEAMCERAGITPFEVGAEHPLRKRVKQAALPSIRTLAEWVTFCDADLEAMGIVTATLDGFVLPPEERDVLQDYAGDSLLYRRPLVRFSNDVVIALPTAIGPAIRTAVIDLCRSLGARGERALLIQHLSLVANQLLETPMIQGLGMTPSPLSLEPVIHNRPVEVDPGYWVQVVLVTDNLVGFEQDGLMGPSRNGTQVEIQLEAAIQAARNHCEASPDFKVGLTYVVTCGFGREQMIRLPNHEDQWFVEATNAYDADVLGWRSDFSIADLLRLVMVDRDLVSKGFKIPHVNGLLAQVGDALGNRGHLIPHEALPDGMTGGMIVGALNSQLQPRVDHHQHHDQRVVPTPDGKSLDVRKGGSGDRVPGGVSHVYVATNDIMRGRLRAVWLRGCRTWWVELRPKSDDVSKACFAGFDALRTWMERIGPVLDEVVPELPDLLLWDLRIDPQPPTLAIDLVPAGADEIRAAIEVNCDASGVVATIVAPEFWRGLSNPDNVAEATLVKAFVRGALRLVGRDELEASAIIGRIVSSPQARQLHAFAPQDFQDYMRGTFDGRVVHVSQLQDGAIRIGLGWSGVARPGGWVRGAANCTTALNAITIAAEADLCDDLARFSRRSLMEAALRNHEAAEVDERRWKKTAGAIIALSDDEVAMRAEVAETFFKLNAVSLACRLLMEIGLHHCPEEGGLEVGDIDLSRLMARAMMVTHLGGYSDAIRYGAMKPEIRVSPAGEVQIDTSFFEGVMDPVGQTSPTGRSTVNSGTTPAPSENRRLPTSPGDKFWTPTSRPLGRRSSASASGPISLRWMRSRIFVRSKASPGSSSPEPISSPASRRKRKVRPSSSITLKVCLGTIGRWFPSDTTTRIGSHGASGDGFPSPAVLSSGSGRAKGPMS